MVVIEVNNEEISLNLSTTEAFGSLTCCCPPTNTILHIRGVRAVDNIWDERKGIRVCGTGIPFSTMLGTRMYWEGKDFCIMYYNTPGVVIEFSHGNHARWLVSTPQYREIVADLESRMEVLRGIQIND